MVTNIVGSAVGVRLWTGRVAMVFIDEHRTNGWGSTEAFGSKITRVCHY